MPLFPRRRASAASQDVKPRHIEIWENLLEVNHVLKRLIYVSSTTSFLAIAFAVWMALLAFERPVVYYVDPAGAATYGGRLGNIDVPQEAEIRYLTRRFLQHTMAFNSLTIESDLAEGANLMTSDLRDMQARELAQYQTDRGMSFVSFVKAQEIRTALDFQRIEVTNHNDKTWAVRVTGTLRTWPLSRVGEEAGFAAKTFEVNLTFIRVPRTELTPNGLLVSHQARRFFEAPDQAKALEQTVPSSETKR